MALPRVFRVLSVAIVAGAVVVGAPAPSGATHSRSSPWNQTDGTAARSRNNAAETKLSPRNVAGVQLLRSIPTPPPYPPNDEINCGTTFQQVVLDRGSAFFAANGVAERVDAATGQVMWSAPAVIGQPATTIYDDILVQHGVVVVSMIDCISQSDPGSMIIAFDETTGVELWRNGSIGGALQAFNGDLLVDTFNTLAALGSISVLDIETGSVRWSDDTCGQFFVSRPVLVANMVVRQCEDFANPPHLEARRLASGAEVWTRPGSWAIWAGDLPGNNGRHVFVGDAAGQINDLNPLTGRTRYSLPNASAVLAVDSSSVFALCSADGNTVCAYARSTGRQRWSSPLSAGGPAPAALANGVLYLGNGIALRAANGSVITRLFTGGGYQMLVGDGRVAAFQRSGVHLNLYGLPGS